MTEGSEPSHGMAGAPPKKSTIAASSTRVKGVERRVITGGLFLVAAWLIVEFAFTVLFPAGTLEVLVLFATTVPWRTRVPFMLTSREFRSNPIRLLVLV